MAEDDEERIIHPRVLLFNDVIAIISGIILIISTIFLLRILNDEIFLGTGKNLVVVFLIGNTILQCIDLYCWYYIKKQTKFNHEKVANLYIIPIVADVIMIFLFGLGAVLIFLRVVIYGNINPDDGIFEDEDPLFQ